MKSPAAAARMNSSTVAGRKGDSRNAAQRSEAVRGLPWAPCGSWL